VKAALAAPDYERPLLEELGSRLVEQRERLFLYNGEDPVWAQNLWLEPQRFEFTSISQAAKHLRGIQRNWHLHSTGAHRRAQLIQEQLPPLKPRPLAFMAPLPTAPLGSWTLLDEKTLFYSARCSSPFADGEVHFAENKIDPPSRAYLKLWEWFTLNGRAPGAGERVLDLGSSPGGWTWVLDQLGCEVFSVDKAPLAENLNLSSRVRYVAESAFALDPAAVGAVDWLFSDIICYPERLLDLVRRWEGFARNFVCTIKFQGPTNHDVVREFMALPGARVRHLFHNKHELTWSCVT
jgi:23S rRNA (cytidine2498-2'-O)-methyltransferase